MNGLEENNGMSNTAYLDKLQKAVKEAESEKDKAKNKASSDRKAYEKALTGQSKLEAYQELGKGTKAKSEAVQLSLSGALRIGDTTHNNIMRVRDAMKLLVRDLIWLASHTERMLINGDKLKGLLDPGNADVASQIEALEAFNEKIKKSLDSILGVVGKTLETYQKVSDMLEAFEKTDITSATNIISLYRELENGRGALLNDLQFMNHNIQTVISQKIGELVAQAGEGVSTGEDGPSANQETILGRVSASLNTIATTLEDRKQKMELAIMDEEEKEAGYSRIKAAYDAALAAQNMDEAPIA
ncbi:MAG: hypothetical protein AAF135_25535 [Bacteroidota bacterium]